MADLKKLAMRMTDKAFQKLGSLAEVVTFTKSGVGQFDMALGEVASVAAPVSIPAKAVISKSVREGSTIIRTLLLQASIFPAIDSTYSLTFSDGTVWAVDPAIERGPTLVTIQVTREGNGQI